MNLPNTEEVEKVHSLTDEELAALSKAYQDLKYKVEREGYEMALDDQKIVVDWLRADRETKFILNTKPVKEKKERVPRAPKEPKPPKEPKVKKPKKLTQRALGTLIIKELKGEELTEEERRNKEFTLTGEIT